MRKDIHPKYDDTTVTCACGNVMKVRSTASDMVKYLQANLNSDIIDSKLHNAMALAHQSSFKSEEQKTEMALAWHIENGKFLMHNGATGGYCAMSAIDKGNKKGVVVLTNTNENVDAIGLSGLITPSLDEMIHLAREMERQGFTATHQETELPDAQIQIAPGIDFLVDDLSAIEWREAHRACKGMGLRTEIFAEDAVKSGNTEEALKRELSPLSVATHNRSTTPNALLRNSKLESLIFRPFS